MIPSDDIEFEHALDRLWREADRARPASAGFEERLFARLAPMRAARPMALAMPWWVRVAGERHVALALLIAGLLAVSPAWWFGAAAPVRAALASLARGIAPAFAPLFAPQVELGLAFALAPVLAWGSFRLARAIERKTARATLGRMT